MESGMMAHGCPWGVPFHKWSFAQLIRALDHFSKDKEDASFFPNTIRLIRRELNERKKPGR